MASLRCSTWAKNYYSRKRKEGKKAYHAIAGLWVLIAVLALALTPRMAKGFFDIKAWQKSDDLAVDVYDTTKSFLARANRNIAIARAKDINCTA